MIFNRRNKIFILGNQKSGTSAIAHLLADAAGVTKTVDIPPLWPPNIQKVVKGDYSLSLIVQSNNKYFKSRIIKEPNLTFLFDSLKSLYPNATYSLVVRNPLDNIRSILNRYNLPGTISKLSSLQKEALASHYNLFQAENWNLELSNNPIQVLAQRWVAAANVIDQGKIIIIRYEDFMKDKIGFIHSLCTSLNLKVKKDISNKIDLQYQPKGDNSLNHLEYYGAENLSIVKEICWPKALEFSYHIDG